ncbi:MAG: hypothetical protein E4H11_08135, partial [Myxococcales bacterium]
MGGRNAGETSPAHALDAIRYLCGVAAGLQRALDAHRRSVEAFRWDVPDSFNFGRDVVDRLAAGPERPALLWRSSAGAERRLSFADAAVGSNRVARVLRDLGVGAGDPVLVMLPRVPEWHLVLIGVLKIGALAIPCSTVLRPKDIAYRAGHSGAVAVIASAAQTAAVDAVAGQIPSLRYRLCLREDAEPLPDAWIDL